MQLGLDGNNREFLRYLQSDIQTKKQNKNSDWNRSIILM